MSQRKVVGLLVIYTATAYLFLGLRTASRYQPVPLGDARAFTLMAIHYRDPAAIKRPLPQLYASRLLPSMLVGAVCRPWLAYLPLNAADSQEALEKPVNQLADEIVRRGFLALNFLATMASTILLFLILRQAGVRESLSVGLAMSYPSLFIAARLFLNWNQMADPTGLALVAGLVYCMTRRDLAVFVALACLGALTRENTLFLLPCFWLVVGSSKSAARKTGWLLASLAPLALFLLVRWRPYFPAAALPPNAQFPLPEAQTRWHWLLDYGYILSYHLATAPWRNLALMPFYTFGALAFVPSFSIRTAAKALRPFAWLLPFALLCLLSGFWVDRQLFYLFPAVYLAAGLTLDRLVRTDREAALICALIVALHVYLYDHWIAVGPGDLFADRHQLVYTFDAASYWMLFLKTAVVGGALRLALWLLARRARPCAAVLSPS